MMVNVTQLFQLPSNKSKGYSEWLGTLPDFKVFLEQLPYFRPESASPDQTLMCLSAH